MIRIGLRTTFDFVPDALGLGFDYMELPLTRIASLSPAEFEELAAWSAAVDMKPEVLYDMLPASIRVNGIDVRAGQQHEYLDLAFARARRLGAQIVVFDAAASRGVPPAFDFDMARRQTGNFLRIVQGHASGSGLRVAIQNLRHTECNLINTVSEAALMAALLQLSCVGVAADTIHMAYASEPVDAIGRCGDKLLHLHTGCALKRTLPHAGDGEDYTRLFRLLTHKGYNGRVSAVSEAPYTRSAAEEALRCLRAAREAVFQ